MKSESFRLPWIGFVTLKQVACTKLLLLIFCPHLFPGKNLSSVVLEKTLNQLGQNAIVLPLASLHDRFFEFIRSQWLEFFVPLTFSKHHFNRHHVRKHNTNVLARSCKAAKDSNILFPFPNVPLHEASWYLWKRGHQKYFYWLPVRLSFACKTN